jgi:hypothetical protein
MLQAIKEFQLQRLVDYTTLTSLAQQAWEGRQLPQLDAVPLSARYTAVGTFAAAHLVFMLMTRSGRRVIFSTVDTVCTLARKNLHQQRQREPLGHLTPPHLIRQQLPWILL